MLQATVKEVNKAARLLPFLAVVIFLGIAVPLVIDGQTKGFAPFLFLFLVTLPLLSIPIRALARKPIDLFAPEVFFVVYFWLHMGLGTFLFMVSPIPGMELPTLIPILNIGALYAFFGALLLTAAMRGSTRRRKIRDRISAAFGPYWSQARLKQVLAVGIMISLAAAFIFYRRAGGVPALFSNVEEGRVDAIWGNAYAAFIALSVAYFYLAYWARHISFPQNKVFTPALLILLLFILALQASFGYRSKIVWFIVTMLVVFNYLRTRIKLRTFVIAGLILLVFVVGVGIWRISTATGSDGPARSLFGFLDFGQHMFKRSTVGFIAVTKIFPEQMDFQWGRIYTYPLTILLPGHQAEFGTWLKDVSDLDFKGGGLPPSMVGELYLNFNALGALIVFFLIGLFYAIFCYHVRRYPTILNVLLYAVLVRSLGEATTGGYSGTIGIRTIWAVFLVLVMYWLVARIPVSRTNMSGERDTNDPGVNIAADNH